MLCGTEFCIGTHPLKYSFRTIIDSCYFTVYIEHWCHIMEILF